MIKSGQKNEVVDHVKGNTCIKKDEENNSAFVKGHKYIGHEGRSSFKGIIL